MDRVETYISERYKDNREVRECLISLYQVYNAWNLKDTKFDIDFTDGRDEHFYSYIWEMLLAAHLKSIGIEIESSDEGPDFKVNLNGQTTWIEAICPSPEGIPRQWLEPRSIRENPRVFNVPHQEMLLRWTSSLKEKKEKLLGRAVIDKKSNKKKWIPGYLEKGIVSATDSYVIAISSSRLGFGTDLLHYGISQLPFAVEAAFPVGPIEIVFNKHSLEALEQRHSHRPTIKKPTGAEVPTDSFLNSNYEHVSAILGSPAGVNAVCGDKSPIVVVHNPLAVNKLPTQVLGADAEYIAEEKEDSYELVNICS